MAQQQNIYNGVAPQVKQQPPVQFNGIHSSHSSSRDSSPSGFNPTVPRPAAIPASQLPPTRSPNVVAQKLEQLNINSPHFSTSTPNQTLQNPSGLSSAFSPINPVKSISSANSQVNTDVVSNNLNSNMPARNLIGQNVPSTTAFNNNPSQTLTQQQPPRSNVFNQNAQRNVIGQGSALGNGPGLSNIQKTTGAPPAPLQAFNGPQPTQTQNVFGQGPINKPPVISASSQSQGVQKMYTQFPHQQPPSSQSQSYIGLNKPPTPNNMPPNYNYPQQQQQQQPQRSMGQPPQGPPAASIYTNVNPPPPKLQSSQSQPKLMQNQQIQFGHNYNSSPNLAQVPPQPVLQQPQHLQQQRNILSNRYPQQPGIYSQPQQAQVYTQVQQQQQQQQQQPQNLIQSGFNRLWGQEHFDLLQNPNVLPTDKVEGPKIHLGQEALDAANCSNEIFRCTVTKIPENNSLLQKSRLPLGVLIHPFKDLNHLPVIQCSAIVRCRACRTYINPFVFFVDSKRWKCNLCYRVNDLPDEFQFDPVSKTYGDPSRRPEIRASTIEYIAPAEYMLRPPQPAVYLFLFDVSRMAVESGYLQSACNVLLEELKNLPGDARTQVGIITYDSALHFFALGEGLSQPHEMTVLDIDDVFLPCPDNLLVNLKDRSEMLIDLLNQLPSRYNYTYDNSSALGAALQVAHKMIGNTGGRITVFQCSLPNVGPGALVAREDPSQRASTEVAHLNPANDFYKRLSLECSGQQIAVDMFILNSQYVDVATISGISRFSGGCVHHFPLFKASRYVQNEQFERCFRRYLTRKIGFEAVMRVRCTRGLGIHTFHGNFFVRSTDLLSLPNVNPDAGFGMQVSIDENLSDVQTVCFQAALLYTSSKGERRIRVHTMCLPVCANLSEIIHSADQQCIVGLLAKMAVDRSMQSSLSDAREAFLNVAIDILSSYKLSQNMSSGMSALLAPSNLRLLPLYISAILKHPSFRTGTTTRLDDRVQAMINMKTKPLAHLIQSIYPDLYPVHNLEEQPVITNADDEVIPQPPRLQLSARVLDSKGAFLLDMGKHMILLVGPGVPQAFLNEALGVRDYVSIADDFYELPILDNLHNQRLHMFISHLQDEKPYAATLQVIRDNSPSRVEFYERLIEDRVENALSYHEFLQHLKSQVK